MRIHDEPGRARRSREVLCLAPVKQRGRARRSRQEPGEARQSQEEPDGARRSQGKPGEARRSQEEPGDQEEEPGRAERNQKDHVKPTRKNNETKPGKTMKQPYPYILRHKLPIPLQGPLCYSPGCIEWPSLSKGLQAFLKRFLSVSLAFLKRFSSVSSAFPKRFSSVPRKCP